MAGGICIGFGAFILVIGVLLSILASQINYVGNKALYEQIIVDSKKSPTYDDWAGGYDAKTNYQMVFHFFNLTNADAVATGSKPVYTETGPYVYRRHRKAVDVSFTDGGKKLKYSNFRDYTFDRSASVGDATDVFVNLNPVYLGALAQAQGELGMLTALSSAYVKEALDFLTGDFVPLYLTWFSPLLLDQIKNTTITNLESALNDDEEKATLYFLNAWANATTAPEFGGNWTDMLISEPTQISSGISLESAQKLFDPNELYSLFSEDGDAVWMWTNALNYSDTLTAEFSITYDQLNTVYTWRRDHFIRTYVVAFLKQMGNITELSDLGWMQWVDGSPLKGVSVNDLWANHVPQSEAKWEIFTADNADGAVSSWEMAKHIMNSTNGFGNVYVFQEWLQAQNGGATDFSQWGLTRDQSSALMAYFLTLGYGFGSVRLTEIYGDHAGLYRGKTVQQWVFDCEDYLLPILQPNALPCGVYTNHTSYLPTTIWTGKDHIDKINKYVEWRNMTTIKNLWAGDMDIVGHTALGQFQPGLKGTADETLHVFDTNLIRTVPLKYNNTVVIKNLTAYRYMVDWKTLFAPSEFFHQNITGLANLTGWQQGAPIFLGNWDMAGVENRADYVDGLNLTSTEADWNTVLDVEPTTGNTVQAFQKLQVNIYLPKEASSFWLPFSPFGNNPRTGIAYPIMKVGEYVILSNDLAKMIKNKLGLLPKAKKVGFWVCVSVGPTLALLGVALVVIGHRRRTQDAYEIIN